MTCQPSTRYYLFGLVSWTKAHHCLHTQFSRRVPATTCEARVPRRVWRKACCHCEFTTDWRRVR